MLRVTSNERGEETGRREGPRGSVGVQATKGDDKDGEDRVDGGLEVERTRRAMGGRTEVGGQCLRVHEQIGKTLSLPCCQPSRVRTDATRDARHGIWHTQRVRGPWDGMAICFRRNLRPGEAARARVALPRRYRWPLLIKCWAAGLPSFQEDCKVA